jgi:iron complex outermembrane receptor protein
MRHCFRLFLIATVASCALVSVGRAQTAPTGDGGGPSHTTLGEIVVTANRNHSTVQKTPVAVAVASGEQLSRAGAIDVSGLVKVAPEIQFTPIREKAITFIRGVGQGISAGNADPAVAINLNEAYLPSEMSNLAFFDVDRVEVVYGPQGTLYGRNAVGGAINIITRRPGKVFGGDVTTEIGNDHSIMAMGAVDLPVTSDFSLRIAALRNQHHGYFTNGMSDADTSAVRLSALYEPSSVTSVYLTGAYSHQGGLGDGSQNLPPLTSNPWYLPYDPHTVPLYTRANVGAGALNISHDFDDGVKFVSISGFDTMKQHTNFPAYLNTPGNIQFVSYDLHTTNYTQEFRLSGSSQKLSWIVGLYGYETWNGETSFVRPQTLPALTFVVGPWSQHAEGAAVFGQATYSITDAFRATLGARYSYDKRRLDGANINFFNTGAAQPPSTIIYAGERSDSRPDFKVGLEYDVAPRSLLYASFQTGYNNGGFSTAQAAVGSRAAAPFAPMTVDAWTAGSKNRFFDGRLQLNGEIYYDRFENYQVSARSLVTGQATVFNAARAETYGGQIDARADITSHDELGVSVGLLHAKFLTLRIPAAPFTLDGYDMPEAPRATVNVDYTHHFPLPNGATIDLEGDYRHVSSVWGVYTHQNGSFVPAYSMADASLTYVAEGGRWTLGGYVRNLNNAFTAAFVTGGALPGPGSGFPLPPRTYGVRLTGKF